MKNTIIYALIFILAFVGTTAGVYYYNNKFVNIFEFDFRDATLVEAAKADSIAAAFADSLALSDSTFVENKPVQVIPKKIKQDLALKEFELNKAELKLSEKEKQIENLKNQLEEKKNLEHEEWLKSTIKLYEAMETNVAGNLLKTLPETEARELIYSMKKKKAAEILSNLDTETVKRLTRSQK